MVYFTAANCTAPRTLTPKTQAHTKTPDARTNPHSARPDGQVKQHNEPHDEAIEVDQGNQGRKSTLTGQEDKTEPRDGKNNQKGSSPRAPPAGEHPSKGPKFSPDPRRRRRNPAQNFNRCHVFPPALVRRHKSNYNRIYYFHISILVGIKDILIELYNINFCYILYTKTI